MDTRLLSFAHTILYSLKLEQLSDTRYIQLKGNPDRFGYSQGFLEKSGGLKKSIDLGLRAYKLSTPLLGSTGRGRRLGRGRGRG